LVLIPSVVVIGGLIQSAGCSAKAEAWNEAGPEKHKLYQGLYNRSDWIEMMLGFNPFLYTILVVKVFNPFLYTIPVVNVFNPFRCGDCSFPNSVWECLHALLRKARRSSYKLE
jgi:hypothetical protein